jgi:signal transduction histidine kinase
LRGTESKFGLADAVFELQLSQLRSQEFKFGKIAGFDSRLIDADYLCKGIQVLASKVEIVSCLQDIDVRILYVENKQSDRVLQLSTNNFSVVFCYSDATVSLAATLEDEIGPNTKLRRARHVDAGEFGPRQRQKVTVEAEDRIRPESRSDDLGFSDAKVVAFRDEIEITCDGFIDGVVQRQALRRLGRRNHRKSKYESDNPSRTVKHTHARRTSHGVMPRNSRTEPKSGFALHSRQAKQQGLNGTDTLVYEFRTAMANGSSNLKETTIKASGSDIARRPGVIQRVGFVPKIVTAQRLQTWLLVAALVAIGLTALLVIDLARNLRTVVISEATRALANAVGELAQAGDAWQTQSGLASIPSNKADQDLRGKSYEILASYPDVEGGYLWNQDVIGHSFPTYTEPGSTLRQPAFEHAQVLSALEESQRENRTATRIAQDGRDLVLVAVRAKPGSPLAAWTLRRIFNFSNSNELYKRIFLVGAMLAALVAICIVLKLSFSLQRGFAVIQTGLERLQNDPDYRLPDQDHELRNIVQAINTMAGNREKLEAALRREDRLRVMGRVVAGIAHEIRNPLNGIRLTIRVLARRLQGNRETEEPIGMITSEIDRLDALLKSLLAFRADEPPKIRRQPVQPIVERTLALVEPHATENGISLEVYSASDGEAPVDADCLQQALMNLLLNAIDASGEHGRVRVSTLPVNAHLEIVIEDSGPGLNSEQQERIFEAFYTTKPGGTGLGLAVTKTLLEKMGAAIECTNGSSGARFRVVLPAAS